MIAILANTDNDFKTIIEIAEIVWPVTYGTILSKEQLDFMFQMMYSISALQEQATSKQHHFILAYENKVPIGFASYEFNCNKSNKTKVHKIYILPHLQGRGIGRDLIDYVIKEALYSRNDAIYLNVNRYNNAKHFYKKIGFRIVKEEDIDIGNGYLMEDYVMEKTL
ncbi:GNAT family N-acetyltransferase [Flavobacterium sp.]